MARFFEWAHKKFKGDPKLAAEYLPLARTLLGNLHDISKNVGSNARQVVLNNGVKITVGFAGAINSVMVDVRTFVVAARERGKKFVFVVSATSRTIRLFSQVGGFLSLVAEGDATEIGWIPDRFWTIDGGQNSHVYGAKYMLHHVLGEVSKRTAYSGTADIPSIYQSSGASPRYGDNLIITLSNHPSQRTIKVESSDTKLAIAYKQSDLLFIDGDYYAPDGYAGTGVFPLPDSDRVSAFRTVIGNVILSNGSFSYSNPGRVLVYCGKKDPGEIYYSNTTGAGKISSALLAEPKALPFYARFDFQCNHYAPNFFYWTPGSMWLCNKSGTRASKIIFSGPWAKNVLQNLTGTGRSYTEVIVGHLDFSGTEDNPVVTYSEQVLPPTTLCVDYQGDEFVIIDGGSMMLPSSYPDRFSMPVTSSNGWLNLPNGSFILWADIQKKIVLYTVKPGGVWSGTYVMTENSTFPYPSQLQGGEEGLADESLSYSGTPWSPPSHVDLFNDVSVLHLEDSNALLVLQSPRNSPLSGPANRMKSKIVLFSLADGSHEDVSELLSPGFDDYCNTWVTDYGRYLDTLYLPWVSYGFVDQKWVDEHAGVLSFLASNS